MGYELINLTKSSNIEYTIRRLARQSRPFLSVIHIAFSGNYRDGSAGAPDAHFICGTVNILYNIWRPSGIIIDFTNLVYEWGNEMLFIFGGFKEPFAIVISDKCEPAISTLSGSNNVLDREEFFDSFDAASEHVRSKVVEEWNMKVDLKKEWFSKSDIITIADLS